MIFNKKEWDIAYKQGRKDAIEEEIKEIENRIDLINETKAGMIKDSKTYVTISINLDERIKELEYVISKLKGEDK
jgi:hypothetical protein